MLPTLSRHHSKDPRTLQTSNDIIICGAPKVNRKAPYDEYYQSMMSIEHTGSLSFEIIALITRYRKPVPFSMPPNGHLYKKVWFLNKGDHISMPPKLPNPEEMLYSKIYRAD